MTAAQFRAIRKALHLTQSEWGQLLGISTVQVSRIETGARVLTETVARLAVMIQKHGIAALQSAKSAL
jgi:DNA-binding transcriptional regulator YiaG